MVTIKIELYELNKSIKKQTKYVRIFLRINRSNKESNEPNEKLTSYETR